jgi:hypothetical protein
MIPVKLFHSSELNEIHWDAWDSYLPGARPDHYAPGWYVCPFIPEGAIIDHRLRGPFETTADAFRMQARIEAGREW